MQRSVSIAVADQAMLSLFNLALNAGLIALASPYEFGHYVFAATVILLMTSLQNALVSMPVSVIYPRRSPDQQARTLADILQFDLVFRAAAAVAAPVICLLTEADPLFLAAAACAVFAGLARETQRSIALAQDRVRELIRLDAVAVATSAIAALALVFVMRPSVAVLCALAIGSTVAVKLSTRIAVAPASPVTAARQYVPIWRESRWSLIGAATTELQYRSYILMLELFRDAKALADVQAGRLLLGPLPLLVGAWGRVARPALARRLAAGDTRGALLITLKGLAGVLAAGALVGLGLLVVWPLLETYVFRGRYADVGLMTSLWYVCTMLAISHMVLSAPLMAALRLAELAQVTMVTAVIAIALLMALALDIPTAWAVIVVMICELIALIWIAVLNVRLFRDPRCGSEIDTAAGQAPALAAEGSKDVSGR